MSLFVLCGTMCMRVKLSNVFMFDLTFWECVSIRPRFWECIFVVHSFMALCFCMTYISNDVLSTALALCHYVSVYHFFMSMRFCFVLALWRCVSFVLALWRSVLWVMALCRCVSVCPSFVTMCFCLPQLCDDVFLFALALWRCVSVCSSFVSKCFVSHGFLPMCVCLP